MTIAESATEATEFDIKAKRRKRWVELAETVAIMFGLVWSIVYPLMTIYEPVDLMIFMDAGAGRDMTGFYYAPWSLPFFALLDLLPLKIAAITANILSWAGFLYAIRVFKGNATLMFISYPFLMLTFYGQIDGVYAFGLALMYLSLRKGKDVWASVGWMIAIVKFYVGLPLGLGLWLYFAKDRRSQIKIVLLMALYGFASLIIWRNWIPDLLERSAAVPPNFDFSMDLWRYTGPLILLLWIPVFLSRKRDFVWWVVTWILTVPYLYVWTLTFLIMFPVGQIIWAVQISYATGFVVSTFLQIIPLIIYLQRWWKSWQTDWLSIAVQGWHNRAAAATNSDSSIQ